MKHWTEQERVAERERLEYAIQGVIARSDLFDELTVYEFKRLSEDLRDCLRKWTAKGPNEGK